MALDYLTRIDEDFSSITDESESRPPSLVSEESSEKDSTSSIPVTPNNENAVNNEASSSTNSFCSEGSSDYCHVRFSIDEGLYPRSRRRKSRVFNTSAIPQSLRVKTSPIDGYILYIPNLQTAVELWRQLSRHSGFVTCKQQLKRSGLVTSMQTYERLRTKMIYLTESNTTLFPESRRDRKARAMANSNTSSRRHSYASWQLIEKNHAREQRRLREFVGEVEKRRSNIAITPIRYNLRSPGACPECGHGTCTCEANRPIVSAPLGKRTLAFPNIEELVKLRKRKEVRIDFKIFIIIGNLAAKY